MDKDVKEDSRKKTKNEETVSIIQSGQDFCIYSCLNPGNLVRKHLAVSCSWGLNNTDFYKLLKNKTLWFKVKPHSGIISQVCRFAVDTLIESIMLSSLQHNIFTTMCTSIDWNLRGSTVISFSCYLPTVAKTLGKLIKTTFPRDNMTRVNPNRELKRFKGCTCLTYKNK